MNEEALLQLLDKLIERVEVLELNLDCLVTMVEADGSVEEEITLLLRKVLDQTVPVVMVPTLITTKEPFGSRGERR